VFGALRGKVKGKGSTDNSPADNDDLCGFFHFNQIRPWFLG
jgi:hypothetical protein